jgi:hypothetical protein
MPEMDEQYYFFHLYAYISDEYLIKSLWNFPDYQWDYEQRHLTGRIDGAENDMEGEDSITELVNQQLVLRSLNSSFSFIPANNEIMRYLFTFVDDGYILETDHFIFKVRSSIGLDSWVYSQEIPKGPFEYYTSYIINWNGDINIQNHPQFGHLVNPEIGPFYAVVQIFDDNNNFKIQTTDVITYVSPKIDTVYVAQDPWMATGHINDQVNMRSLIVGKVDKSGDPMVDYHRYVPQGEPLQDIQYWSGNLADHVFTDLCGGARSPYHRWYRNGDSGTWTADKVWSNLKYGDLEFKWYVVHDKRGGQNGGEYSGAERYDRFLGKRLERGYLPHGGQASDSIRGGK